MIAIVLAYLDTTGSEHRHGDSSTGTAAPGSSDPAAATRPPATARRHRARHGARHGQPGQRHRPVQGTVPRGMAGTAVRDRPARHRPSLRPRRHRVHLAPRPARRALQQQVRHPRRRSLQQHPRPHPPRRPAPRQGLLRMARLHQARRLLRHPPPAPPAARRRDIPVELRPFVPIPPRHLHPPPRLAARPAPRRHHHRLRPQRAGPPQPRATRQTRPPGNQRPPERDRRTANRQHQAPARTTPARAAPATRNNQALAAGVGMPGHAPGQRWHGPPEPDPRAVPVGSTMRSRPTPARLLAYADGALV